MRSATLFPTVAALEQASTERSKARLCASSAAMRQVSVGELRRRSSSRGRQVQATHIFRSIGVPLFSSRRGRAPMGPPPPHAQQRHVGEAQGSDSEQAGMRFALDIAGDMGGPSG